MKVDKEGFLWQVKGTFSLINFGVIYGNKIFLVNF